MGQVDYIESLMNESAASCSTDESLLLNSYSFNVGDIVFDVDKNSSVVSSESVVNNDYSDFEEVSNAASSVVNSESVAVDNSHNFEEVVNSVSSVVNSESVINNAYSDFEEQYSVVNQSGGYDESFVHEEVNNLNEVGGDDLRRFEEVENVNSFVEGDLVDDVNYLNHFSDVKSDEYESQVNDLSQGCVNPTDFDNRCFYESVSDLNNVNSADCESIVSHSEVFEESFFNNIDNSRDYFDYSLNGDTFNNVKVEDGRRGSPPVTVNFNAFNEFRTPAVDTDSVLNAFGEKLAQAVSLAAEGLHL